MNKFLLTTVFTLAATAALAQPAPEDFRAAGCDPEGLRPVLAKDGVTVLYWTNIEGWSGCDADTGGPTVVGVAPGVPNVPTPPVDTPPTGNPPTDNPDDDSNGDTSGGGSDDTNGDTSGGGSDDSNDSNGDNSDDSNGDNSDEKDKKDKKDKKHRR